MTMHRNAQKKYEASRNNKQQKSHGGVTKEKIMNPRLCVQKTRHCRLKMDASHRKAKCFVVQLLGFSKKKENKK